MNPPKHHQTELVNSLTGLQMQRLLTRSVLGGKYCPPPPQILAITWKRLKITTPTFSILSDINLTSIFHVFGKFMNDAIVMSDHTIFSQKWSGVWSITDHFLLERILPKFVFQNLTLPKFEFQNLSKGWKYNSLYMLTQFFKFLGFWSQKTTSKTA